VLVKKASLDRRTARRVSLKTPLRVRIWKSPEPEERAESLNLSQGGVYFATESPIREGDTVEVILKMPEELTDEPTTEWRCTGHVVRAERIHKEPAKVGIGVQFDCYEVSRPAQGHVDAFNPSSDDAQVHAASLPSD
jgi:c-di-GMP-binding flagellar brake protein YcgR